MKPTFDEKVLYAVNTLLLSLAGLSCVLPLLHLAAVSLSDPGAIISGRVTLWPVDWDAQAYEALLRGTPLARSFQNSVLITVAGVALSLAASIVTAYPLSRPYFIGRRLFSMAIVLTMMFGGGLIPSYLLAKSLGLIDSYWAIWLPGLVSTYNMWVMRTFFQGIPGELEDAARIDGCGETGLLLRIILPTSMPMLATIALFYAVGYWNNFFGILIFIQDTAKYNLAVLVQQMILSTSDPNLSVSQDLQQSITPEGVKAAGVMVMVIPMLLVYPFIQKHFVKGVMIGALKE